MQESVCLLVVGTCVLLAEAWNADLTMGSAADAGQQNNLREEEKSFETDLHLFTQELKEDVLVHRFQVVPL